MNASNEDEAVMDSEEMLARSSTWTLACDSMLLNKLQKFSKELERQSSEVKEECNKLSSDTVLLQAKLHNMTNQFMMLSNTQFVENRVQDFEETTKTATELYPQSKSSAKKTKAEKESELIAKMKEAIQMGVSVSSQHLQSLSQDLPSSKLALPYLIGSPKYFSNRYVGLVDEVRYPADPYISTNAILENKTDDLEPLRKSHSNYYVSVSSTESNSSMPSSNSSNIPIFSSIPPENVPSSPTLIKGSLGSLSSSNSFSYPQYQQTQPPPVIPAPKISNKAKPTTAAEISKEQERFFDDEPPPPVEDSEDSDEDFQPIVRPGGAGRLFADEDDEDNDIFKDSSLFPSTKTANTFFNPSNFTGNHAPNHPRPASPPPLEVNRHNQNNNIAKVSASDIGNKPNKNPDVRFVNSSNIIGANQSVQNNVQISGSKSKIPTGGVSIFGSVPPAEIPRLQTLHNTEPKSVVEEPETRLQGSIAPPKCVTVSKERGSSVGTNEDQDTTSHSSLTSRGLTSSQGSLSEPPAISVSRPTKPAALGILNDDSDDDLFYSKRPPPPPVTSTKTSATLFGDNKTSDHHQPVPVSSLSKKNQQAKKKFKSSIFDDSDSEEDLFYSGSSTSSKTNQSKPAKSLVFSSEQSTVTGNAITKGGLFGDDDDDSEPDLFNTNHNVNKLNSNQHKKTVSSNQIRNTLSRSTPSDNRKKMDSADTIKSSADDSTFHEEVDTDSLVSKSPPPPSPEVNSAENNLNLEETLKSVEVENSEPKSEEMKTRSGKIFGMDTAVDKITTEENAVAAAKEANPESEVGSEKSKTEEPMKTRSGKIVADVAVADSTENKDVTDKKAPSNNDAFSDLKSSVSKGKESKISKLKEKLSKENLVSSAKPLKTTDENSNDTVKMSAAKSKDFKKRALGLNINPLAMMPGAKPKKQSSADSPVSDTQIVSPSLSGTPDSPPILSPLPVISPVGAEEQETSAKSTPSTSEVKLSSESSTEPATTTTSNQVENSNETEKLSPSKSKDFKIRALGLNINPLAMMPGAKPKKQGSVETPDSPASDTQILSPGPSSKPDSPALFPSVTPDERQSSAKSSPVISAVSTPDEETAPDTTGNTGSHSILPNLAKGRAKILSKRKAPSKQFLHAYRHANDAKDTDKTGIEPKTETDVKEEGDSIPAETTGTSSTASESLLSPFESKESISEATTADQKEQPVSTTTPHTFTDSHNKSPLAETTRSSFTDSEFLLTAAKEIVSDDTVPIEKPASPTQPEVNSNTSETKPDSSKKDLFASDSDSDDLFKSSKSKRNSKTADAVGSGTSKTAAKTAPVKKSIFDDDSDDDLFATKPKRKTVP